MHSRLPPSLYLYLYTWKKNMQGCWCSQSLLVFLFQSGPTQHTFLCNEINHNLRSFTSRNILFEALSLSLFAATFYFFSSHLVYTQCCTTTSTWYANEVGPILMSKYPAEVTKLYIYTLFLIHQEWTHQHHMPLESNSWCSHASRDFTFKRISFSFLSCTHSAYLRGARLCYSVPYLNNPYYRTLHRCTQ